MSTATYAAAGSLCEESIVEISARAAFARLGMLASSQVRPLSFVTFTTPLLVPIQITPGETLEQENDSIAAPRPPNCASSSSSSEG